MSGLSVKLVLGIEAWSLGSVLLALLLVQVITVAMGCRGASLTAVHDRHDLRCARPSEEGGVPFDIGQFFAMSSAFSPFSRPPWHLSRWITAKIAEAPYMKTAKESIKAAVAGFMVPYIFVFCPVILLKPREPLFAVVAVIASIIWPVLSPGIAGGLSADRPQAQGARIVLHGRGARLRRSR